MTTSQLGDNFQSCEKRLQPFGGVQVGEYLKASSI